MANTFAVESFTDEIAALARVDPVEFRLKRLSDPRGIEVLQPAAARMGWQPRPSPRPVDRTAAVLTGRGIAYVHYKHAETLVAMGMEVEVERATGRIRVNAATGVRLRTVPFHEGRPGQTRPPAADPGDCRHVVRGRSSRGWSRDHL